MVYPAFGFDFINFLADQCKGLGRLLSSGAVETESLELLQCTFAGDCAQYVAHGLRDFPTPVSVNLSNTVNQQSFADALVSSLPFSTSIMSAPEAEFATEITRRIFLHKSIKHLTIEWHYDTSMLNVEGLKQALERNYTLKHVCFCSKSRPLNATITKLKHGWTTLPHGT